MHVAFPRAMQISWRPAPAFSLLKNNFSRIQRLLFRRQETRDTIGKVNECPVHEQAEKKRESQPQKTQYQVSFALLSHL